MLIKEKWAIALYMFYVVLLYGANVSLIIKFSHSFISSICLIIYLIKNLNYVRKYAKLVKPLWVYFVLCLFTIPLQTELLIDNFRLSFFETFSWALIIGCEGIKNPKNGVFFIKVFIIASLITIIYGALLFFLPRGFNPYMMFLTYFNFTEYNEEYAVDLGRAIPRIFSTWNHPVPYNMFIGSSLIIFISLYKYIKNKIFYILLILITFFALLTSGARSGIVAFILSSVFMFYDKIRIKHIVILFVFVILIISLHYIPESLQDYLLSIIGSQKSTSVGSSAGMRLTQLEGALECMKNNIFFGNGYNWTLYYLQNYGLHPKAITFESLLFYVIANHGIIGFVIWGTFILMQLRLVRKTIVSRFSRLSLYSLTFYFIIYTGITGLYSCFSIYVMCFYVAYAMHIYMNASKQDI